MVFVPGRKPWAIWYRGEPVLQAFQNVRSTWPNTIIFGQGGFSIPYAAYRMPGGGLDASNVTLRMLIDFA
ncbi:hypothetical protein SBA3_1820004 [Candidatus Sulfopaludibacter sp. SbA3]|nr:hypothetical protein SBA3_1820004 [Candidatus Sulfopaludibacter sp. SbA3]